MSNFKKEMEHESNPDVSSKGDPRADYEDTKEKPDVSKGKKSAVKRLALQRKKVTK